MTPIATHPLFEGVASSITTRCMDKARPITLPKGGILFHAGDKVESLHMLLSGWLKLSRETQNGDEAVLDIVTQGTLIGESLILRDRPYPYTAQAVEASELIALPLLPLRELLAQDARLSRNVTQRMSQHQQRLEMEIEHLTVQTAPQRIGCFLLHAAGHHTNGETRFDLPFEKSLIAAKLGMKPETFSRALNQLKQAGVEVEGKQVHITSITALSSFTCAACSNNYPCED